MIYHYTTNYGLQGILTGDCVHASHYRFMNDPAEISRNYRAVEQLLIGAATELHKTGQAAVDLTKAPDKFLATIPSSRLATNEDFIEWYGKGIAEAILSGQRTSSTPYIASFSKHTDDFTQQNGILSQWRAYGLDGGYAIGLDERALRLPIEEEAAKFKIHWGGILEVAYKDVEWTTEVMDLATKLMSQAISSALEKAPGSPLWEITTPIFETLFTHKSPAFADEREARAVILTYDKADVPADVRTVKPVEFKPRGGALVPYIKIFEGSVRSALNRVLIGPHPNQDRRHEGVALFLKSIGLDRIPIERSEIELTNYH